MKKTAQNASDFIDKEYTQNKYYVTMRLVFPAQAKNSKQKSGYDQEMHNNKITPNEIEHQKFL